MNYKTLMAIIFLCFNNTSKPSETCPLVVSICQDYLTSCIINNQPCPTAIFNQLKTNFKTYRYFGLSINNNTVKIYFPKTHAGKLIYSNLSYTLKATTAPYILSTGPASAYPSTNTSFTIPTSCTQNPQIVILAYPKDYTWCPTND